jgi:hypothetical protein
MTYQDLLSYCEQQARMQFADYGDITSYHQDKYERTKQRKALLKQYGFLLRTSIELLDGESSNGRFKVSNGIIDYTAGQYAPTEIYDAALSYIKNSRWQQHQDIGASCATK